MSTENLEEAASRTIKNVEELAGKHMRAVDAIALLRVYLELAVARIESDISSKCAEADHAKRALELTKDFAIPDMACHHCAAEHHHVIVVNGSVGRSWLCAKCTELALSHLGER